MNKSIVTAVNELKSNIEVLKKYDVLSSNPAINHNLEYLESMIQELYSYNLLLQEDHSKIGEVNLWPAIKSCVKSTNLYNNKANRPKCMVTFVDKVDNHNLLFDVEKNSNEENGLACFKLDNCLSVMNLVPTLLIDNALKYCNPGGDININIEREEKMTSFSFENLGPALNKQEIAEICDPDMRGSNAVKTNIEGQGLGLYLFRVIMEMHNYLCANFDIMVDDSIVKINGIDYSKFTISFSILNNPVKEITQSDCGNLQDDLNNFIEHQYLRIMPRLCKVTTSIVQNAFSKAGLEVREMLYCFKDQLMSLIVTLQKQNNLFYEFSERSQCIHSRFDRYLEKEIQTVMELYKDDNPEFKFQKGGVHREAFIGTNAISPFIDIFMNDFVVWLFAESGVTDIEINTSRTSVDIEADTDEQFSVDDETFECWQRNLEVNNIKMQVNPRSISFTKLN